MNQRTQIIAERFEEQFEEHGIKTGIEYLQGIKAELAKVSRDIDTMIKTAQSVAVDQGLAQFVTDEPRELAPSKEKFIELFGQAQFDRVKSYSKPRRIFTWLI